MKTTNCSISETLISVLSRRIMDGDWSAGDSLPGENDLALQYAVSRTTVRNALQVLAAKGLINIQAKKRSTVNPQDRWSFLDVDVMSWLDEKGFDHSLMEQLLVTRLIFEPNIAALAALHATEEDIIRLNDACNIMGQGKKLGKKHLFEKGDLAFHLALLDASHNAFMRSLGNALATAMSFSFKQTLEADVRLTKEAVHEHRELLVAVQNKDPQAARWRMRLILEHAAQKSPWQNYQQMFEHIS